MRKLRTFTRFTPVLIGTVLLTPALFARTCVGNGDVVGSYGIFASRDGFNLLGATAPGTNTTGAGPLIPFAVQPTGTSTAGLLPIAVQPPGTTVALVGSNTPWGTLFAGLFNRSAFGANGRVFADGAGNFYASNTFGGLSTNTLVGNYNVNTECSITMTLRDPFTAAAAGGTTGTTTGPSVTLEGELVDGKIEATMTGPTAAGALVTFVKTSQFNGCTVGTVAGNFAIVGSGMVVNGFAGTTTITGSGTTPLTPAASIGAFIYGPTSTLGTPFTLLGKFNADGLGNLNPDVTTSPLKRTLTGTYTVNVDCTGTMQLTDAAGTSRNLRFVLVNETAPVGNSSTGTTGIQSLKFVFSDPGVIGRGTASLQ